MGYGTANKIPEYIPLFNSQDQFFLTNKSLQYFEIEITNSQKNKYIVIIKLRTSNLILSDSYKH